MTGLFFFYVMQSLLQEPRTQEKNKLTLKLQTKNTHTFKSTNTNEITVIKIYSTRICQKDNSNTVIHTLNREYSPNFMVSLRLNKLNIQTINF